MSNKEVLIHCPNFYKISNFSYKEDDYISEKLISVYKEYIFSVDISKSESIRKIHNLDQVISKYIDDYYFRKELKCSLRELRVKKEDNILMVIVDYIIKIFNKYEDGFTRNIYISRWI